MSFLRKSLSDPTVNSKLARTYDIHQYEHYQVYKSQLFRGKRVIAVNYKKGNNHCKHHWYHSQTIEKPIMNAMEHANSPKIASPKDSGLPTPNGSGKTADSS